MNRISITDFDNYFCLSYEFDSETDGNYYFINFKPLIVADTDSSEVTRDLLYL